MSEPSAPGGVGAAWSEPPTALDPGRTRPPDAEVTVRDPGRAEPEQRLGGLPPLLAARFTIGRALHAERSEAEVYLVKERATDETRVVRLYREERYDQQVMDYVANQGHRHIVRIHERGAEAGYRYEVMEHLGGGDLVALRDQNPDGLDAADLTALVRQAAEALTAVHQAGFVHHDVKPANLVLRSQQPLDLALIDFGITVRLLEDEPEQIVDNRWGTVRYMPPEFLGGGLVSQAYDWWSLGMTVRELAVGRALFAGLDEKVMPAALNRSIAFEEIADPRIRLLCQGLLTRDDARRWRAAEILRWLDGEDPQVAQETPVAGAASAEVADSFVYQEVEYRNRALLALAMTKSWEAAATLFFGGGNAVLNELEGWFRQFPEGALGLDCGRRRDPADVRLLRLLRQVSPTHPPIFRGMHVSRARLPQIARRAANGEGNFPDIVAQLYEYRLLPLLAQAPAGAGLDGGDGLAAADAAWRAFVDQWGDHVVAVPDADARGELERLWRTVRPQVLGVCLWAVVATDSATRRMADGLRRLARRARVDWFTALLDLPDGKWAAYLLRDHVTRLVDEREMQAKIEREQGEWLRRNRAMREWARTQNRPLALGWAVAGVCVMAVVCAMFVAVGDVVGWVAPSTILDACS